MIVNHLNTLLDGGAAIASRRLHESLLASGVDSRYWYSQNTQHAGAPKQSDLLTWPRPTWKALYRKLKIKLEKRRYLKGRSRDWEIFSLPQRAAPTPYDPTRMPGILHLHWIAEWLDYPSFFAGIPDEMPVVWTLHDMNPFTGGCHYTSGCESFTETCQNCHQLKRSGENDLANSGFLIKQNAYRNKNIHVVADSHWIQQQAQSSMLLRHARSFQTIHYGLDTTCFTPRNRAQARKRFQIPEGTTVLAFGACWLKNRRKGLRELLDALKQLETSQPLLGLFFGAGQIPHEKGLPELRSVGYIDDPQEQSWLYSAADLFVLPSLEEAFGLTGLEAMACGTPVVGFNTGGIPDFVRPGETGLLAQTGNSTDLARQIRRLIKQPQERRQMGNNARHMIEKEFTLERQSQDYLRLYDKLMAEFPLGFATQKVA